MFVNDIYNRRVGGFRAHRFGRTGRFLTSETQTDGLRQ